MNEIKMNESVMALMTTNFSKMRKRLFSPAGSSVINIPKVNDGISERSIESSPNIKNRPRGQSYFL